MGKKQLRVTILVLGVLPSLYTRVHTSLGFSVSGGCHPVGYGCYTYGYPYTADPFYDGYMRCGRAFAFDVGLHNYCAPVVETPMQAWRRHKACEISHLSQRLNKRRRKGQRELDRIEQKISRMEKKCSSMSDKASSKYQQRQATLNNLRMELKRAKQSMVEDIAQLNARLKQVSKDTWMGDY